MPTPAELLDVAAKLERGEAPPEFGAQMLRAAAARMDVLIREANLAKVARPPEAKGA